jgi:hypothetical protein
MPNRVDVSDILACEPRCVTAGFDVVEIDFTSIDSNQSDLRFAQSASTRRGSPE